MVTKNMFCAQEGKQVGFVTALNLIKCCKKIKLQRFILTCAPISDLPSDISTMSGCNVPYYALII